MHGEFSVFEFYPDGSYTREADHVDAETAVRQSHVCVNKPAAKIGIIKRVIITDADDMTCFEWRYGTGITFPTQNTIEGKVYHGQPR